MYILEGVLFPFEVLIESYNKEDKIYKVITQIKYKSLSQIARYWCKLTIYR